MKLEAIRLAAIPRREPRAGAVLTPFQCVDRVVDVALLASALDHDRRMAARLALEVAGHGAWQRDLKFYVAEYPPGPPEPPPSETGAGPDG